MKFLNYISDDQAHSVDSLDEQTEDHDNEEDDDLEWCDGVFSTDCEEVEEWPSSTQFSFVSPAVAEPSQERCKEHCGRSS